MIYGMANDLRALLARSEVTHVPGVYDPASAALAVRAGIQAVHLSAEAVAGTMLGRPDVGFASSTQIADRAAVLVPALEGVPVLADAAVGFERPDQAVWTALAYERAGINGLILHDGEAVARIAQQAPELVLIVRVTGRDLATTIEWCRRYAAAGADALYPADVQEPADLARIRSEVPGVPLVISASDRDPADGELATVGVRLVLHPLAALLAALRAASQTYRAIAEQGRSDKVDQLPQPVYATLVEPPGRAPAFDRIDT